MYLKYFIWTLLAMSITLPLWSQEPSYQELLEKLEDMEGQDRYEILMDLCSQEVFNDQILARTRGIEGLSIGIDLKDAAIQARSYRCIGLSFHYIDEPDSAMFYYNKSLAMSTDPLTKAGVYDNIRVIHANHGRYDSARQYLILTEKIYREHGSIDDQGSVQEAYGRLALFNAEWNEVMIRYTAADSLYKLSGNINKQADALKGISYVYASEEKYEETIDILKKAHKKYVETNDGFYGSETLNHIGYYYNLLEERDSAIVYHTAGLKQAKEVNNSHTAASCLKDLGELYGDLSQFDKARVYMTEAIPYIESKGDPYQKADHFLALGDLERKAEN